MSDKIVIHDCEQGSPEWHALRFRITATGYQSVQAKGKGGGASIMRADYLEQLARERVYGVPCGKKIKTPDMTRGIEMEPESIQAYMDRTGNVVRRVGFVSLGEWQGCSPDGLIGDDGGIEIKNPMMRTHLNRIKDGVLPSEYKWQIHYSMAVTGRLWWEFVSYHPDAKTSGIDNSLFILRVERDEKICDEIKYNCGKFIMELKTEISSITGMDF